MAHNHILGVWADYDGNVHYEYENTDQLYPVDIFEFCPVCGIKLKIDQPDIKKYEQLDRIDIICGTVHPPKNPCEKCNQVTCEGKGKCKGYGAWSYGISIK